MYSIQKIPEESSCMQASAAHSTINLDSAGLLTGDIPDEFKCPICYEVPQAEIYQCTNGHTICTSCQSKNGRLCPHCRLPFHVESGLIRNRALETLLDSMIVPCPFKKDGCLDNVSRKNVKMHRINCIYNGKCMQLCKVLGYDCDFWTNALNPKPAVDHFHKHHKALVGYCDSITMDFENFMYSVGMMKFRDGVWTPVILSVKGEYFMILTLLNDRDTSVSWQCLRLNDGNGEPGNKFDVEFRIESHSMGMPALDWKMVSLPLLESEGIIRTPVTRNPADLLINHYVDKQNEMLKVTVTVTVSDNSGNKRAHGNGFRYKPPVKVCEITRRNHNKFWEDMKTVSSPVWTKLSEQFNWVRESLTGDKT